MIRLGMIVAVAVGLCGCQGKPAEPAAKQAGNVMNAKDVKLAPKASPKEVALAASRAQVQALEAMAAALAKVEDDATADAVIPQLTKAAERVRMAHQRILDLQKEFATEDAKALEAQFNDPAVQQQFEKVADAGGKLMDASLQAQLKAPGRRKEIQAVCKSTNVETKPK